MVSIRDYRTLVFDCDGVILNSNKIKTEAFYEVAKVFGHNKAMALVDYHVQNGGISRYAKFEYFLVEILEKEVEAAVLNGLIFEFSHLVKQALMACEVAEGLTALREKTKEAKWLIVSGGDQAELKAVFKQRGLDVLFDGGIFGSPNTKDEILAREISNKTIISPVLFLGDSKYDYRAAKQAGLDFVFMSEWSEVEDYDKWVMEERIDTVVNLSRL